MDYIIVSHLKKKEVEKKVIELLQDGYQLVGGISISFVEPVIEGKKAQAFIYAQALLKL